MKIIKNIFYFFLKLGRFTLWQLVADIKDYVIYNKAFYEIYVLQSRKKLKWDLSKNFLARA